MILVFKQSELPIPAGERAQLVAETMVPFNRARLRLAPGWRVHDLKIGNIYQAASPETWGGLSQIFEGDGCDLGQITTALPGMLVTIDVTNASDEARRFDGALVVSMVAEPAVVSYVITVTPDGVNVRPLLPGER